MQMNEIVTGSDIYWITRLDALNAACSVTVLLCAGIALFLAIRWDTAYYEEDYHTSAKERDVLKREWRLGINRTLRTRLSILLVVGSIAGLGSVFVPSTREAIAIKVIPMVANNQDVQGLGIDVVKVAREWLDEMRPNKKDSK